MGNFSNIHFNDPVGFLALKSMVCKWSLFHHSFSEQSKYLFFSFPSFFSSTLPFFLNFIFTNQVTSKVWGFGNRCPSSAGSHLMMTRWVSPDGPLGLTWWPSGSHLTALWVSPDGPLGCPQKGCPFSVSSLFISEVRLILSAPNLLMAYLQSYVRVTFVSLSGILSETVLKK